jgi:HAE1 family hydrophobic/amphiphilic exporter-1
MLVDYTNQRRAAGESIRTALIQANHARLRPILMTTIAMVFGMFPPAFWSRSRMEKRFANYWRINQFTVLTLIIVPVIYEIMEN